MSSGFIYDVVYVPDKEEFPSLVRLNSIHIVSINHILFIYSSVNRPYTAMERDVQISVRVPALSSFGYTPQSGIAGPFGNWFF